MVTLRGQKVIAAVQLNLGKAVTIAGIKSAAVY